MYRIKRLNYYWCNSRVGNGLFGRKLRLGTG